MKKFFIIAMLTSVAMAMGQNSNFSDYAGHKPQMSLKEVTGNTKGAYALMRYDSARKVAKMTCVEQRASDVLADKAEIILEAHKVFGEFAQVGFQMLLDADHNVYGELIYDWAMGYYETSYDSFEYKMPEGADANEMSTNVVIDGETSIQVPAGVYDYMILYPFPGDGLIYASGEFGKFDDFEFKGGCTYRFLVEYGEYDNGDYVGYFPVANLYTDVDAALTSLVLPANGMDITDSEDVTITIANRGKESISQFAVSYQVNDGGVVTETYTGTIAAGEVADYTFATKADMSQEQQYNVAAWVSLEGDMIPSNDKLTGKCKHIGVSSLPFHYDFSEMGVEAFESDWTVEDVNCDDSKWSYSEWVEDTDGNSGVVGCSGCWGDTRTGDDNLISLPIGMSSGDHHILLNSRCVNDEATELLDVLYGTTANVAEMTTIAELKVNSMDWVSYVVNFNVPADGVYYVALRVHSVEGMNVYVDEITVDAGYFEVSPLLVIDRVVLPYSNCDLSDQSLVGATITNKGTGPTDTFKLVYTVDDNEPVEEVFEAVLAPTETATYYFNTRADFSEIGTYNVVLKAITKEEADSELSAEVSNYEPITQLPIEVDFVTGLNYENLWNEMNPGSWERDEFIGAFGTNVSGIENGLISHCLDLKNSVRFSLQYVNGGWSAAGFYVAYGKADADVSTYTKVYEDYDISSAKEVEFVVPITEPDHYSFIIVNESEEDGNLSLGKMTISELLPNDLRLVNVMAPMSSYTPQSQFAGEATFMVEVNNRGTENMTGVKATLLCNDQEVATSEAVSSISGNETVYIPITTTIANVAVGDVVNFAVNLSANEVDGYMDDNSFTLSPVNVTDTVFATENITLIEYGTGAWGEPIRLGNVYEVMVADVLSSVTVGWASVDGDTDMASKLIALSIYAVNEDMTLGRQLFTTTFERGMGEFVTYELDAMKLDPGKYFVEVQQISTYNMGLGIVEGEQSYCYQNLDNTLIKASGVSLVVRANFAHDAVVYDKDVAVVGLVSPVKRATFFTSDEAVTFRVKNMGSNEVDFEVNCKVNETEYTRQLSLLPYEVVDVTFEHIDMSAVGDYVVTATLVLEGDENSANNTITETLTTIEESNRYVMNFEDCYDFDAGPDKFNPTWRTVDRVGDPTDYFWMFEYPYRGEPVGFIVFNPKSTRPAVTEDNLPGFTPRSGERFAAAFCLGYEANSDVSDVWLISPKLPLNTNSSLEFYVKTRMIESMDQSLEPYRVLVSDTNDDFDSFVVVSEGTAPEGEWGLVNVDLKEYDGKEIYVAIQYVGQRYKNVCLMVDDIEVKGDGLGVANVNAEDVYMRYNATEATITVNANEAIQRVELFNLQGQVVYAADANMTTLYRFSVADCPAGVYICKVYTATGTAAQKFVVR